MMAGVDEHLGARAETAAHQCSRPPVGKVGAVEAGLEELVLDEERHLVGQLGVELLQRLRQTREPRRQVVLAGVIRPVREPESDRRRPHLARDLDALATVLERPGADVGARVAEAAEPILVRAEQIRVDRAEPDTLRLRIASQRSVVLDHIPRNVQRDRRAAAGETVDQRGVGPPLVDGPGGTRPRVDVEPRPGVPVPPRGGLDLECGGSREYVVFVHGASLPDPSTHYDRAFDKDSFETKPEVLTSTDRGRTVAASTTRSTSP